MSAIRPIKTEQDYELALARVDEIFDAEPDTAEGDELDVLTTLIEAYEDLYFPIGMPSPISAIKFRMEQEELSQSDLKPYFGSSAKVSEVLSGKRQLTLKMIRALNEHLGIPADVLIQTGAIPADLESVDWQRFPLREMVKLGWIEARSDLKDRAEEIMRGLIERAGGCNALGFALYRKNDTARKNAKTNPYALNAWCIHVLVKAREAKLARKYAPGTITPEFLLGVAKLSSRDEGPRLAQGYLAQHGIALVIAQRLKGTHLDGAAMVTAEGRPVIGMTLRYDRIDNFWFCLLHELAHIGRHIENGQGEFFVDDLSLSAGEDTREQEADEWAEEGLIPAEVWGRHPARAKPSVNNIISLANALQVHPAIIAGRIRHESENYNLLSHFVGQGEVSKHLSFV